MKTLLVRQILSGFFVRCQAKLKFVEGKPTGEVEFVVVILMTKCGEIQILFPPREGKAEEFEKRFSFGTLIEVEEIAKIQDIKVSIYKDELSVKIFADYPEEEA